MSSCSVKGRPASFNALVLRGLDCELIAYPVEAARLESVAMALPHKFDAILDSRYRCILILQDRKLEPGPVSNIGIVQFALVMRFSEELDRVYVLDSVKSESLPAVRL